MASEYEHEFDHYTCLNTIFTTLEPEKNTIYYISIGSLCHGDALDSTEYGCEFQIMPVFLEFNYVLKNTNSHAIIIDPYEGGGADYFDNLVKSISDRLDNVTDTKNITTTFRCNDAFGPRKYYQLNGDSSTIKLDFNGLYMPATIKGDTIPGFLENIYKTKYSTKKGEYISAELFNENITKEISTFMDVLQEFTNKCERVGSAVIVANFAKFRNPLFNPNLDYLKEIANDNYLYLEWYGYSYPYLMKVHREGVRHPIRPLALDKLTSACNGDTTDIKDENLSKLIILDGGYILSPLFHEGKWVIVPEKDIYKYDLPGE